ncbi:MAG: TetR/AcrR family transcriptional regulator [Calditrichaeota bacterium]|nr:MAG: TetR/AcrR family transcriptional regulator [Calditrichota bacterium]
MRNGSIDRKTQILNEATRLFSDAGYDKVTIKQLAEACGITEPALYRHYTSKESIYDAVLDAIEARLSVDIFFEELDKVNEVEDMLRSFASHIITFFTKNEDIYRLLLFSALRGHSKAKRVYQMIRGSYVKYLNQRLDKFYDDGKIIKKNNEITARCFTGMVFDCALSVTLWRGFQGKLYKPEEVVENNVPIYARGLLINQK